MTPQHKIKHAILSVAHSWGGGDDLGPLTAEEIDARYEAMVEAEEHWDAMNEIREGRFETGIPCEWSRHYESKSVALQAFDGSYVGWTYWYGGGKHGEPEAIDWIEDAYDLHCVEEEKLTVVRTFSKPTDQIAA